MTARRGRARPIARFRLKQQTTDAAEQSVQARVALPVTAKDGLADGVVSDDVGTHHHGDEPRFAEHGVKGRCRVFAVASRVSVWTVLCGPGGRRKATSEAAAMKAELACMQVLAGTCGDTRMRVIGASYSGSRTPRHRAELDTEQ